MNKAQAKAAFLNCHGHQVFGNLKDTPFARQLWNDFVDTLVKDGKVSEAMTGRWVNPFLPKDKR